MTPYRYHVYMLRTARGNLYVGVSTDPARRLHEHNNTKKGAKCLRGQRPCVLVWFLGGFTRRAALQFERTLKRLGHDDREAFLVGDLPLTLPKGYVLGSAPIP